MVLILVTNVFWWGICMIATIEIDDSKLRMNTYLIVGISSYSLAKECTCLC